MTDPLAPFLTHVLASWRGAAATREDEQSLRAFIAASSADAAGRDPLTAPEREARVARLLADPALLAALFQHIDVLFASRAREAPGVAALVMAAIERAAAHERGDPAPPAPTRAASGP
ncbi:MAG: hypothetical protein HY275_05870 [Gemmatimonadetes bacterium]|nr:hypothetical protein [Gemmatimonadota bacterium]